MEFRIKFVIESVDLYGYEVMQLWNIPRNILHSGFTVLRGQTQNTASVLPNESFFGKVLIVFDCFRAFMCAFIPKDLVTLKLN